MNLKTYNENKKMLYYKKSYITKKEILKKAAQGKWWLEVYFKISEVENLAARRHTTRTDKHGR